nr:MAG TPA: PcfJ like protein [Siphoviridae sp. ct8TV20]
MARLTNCSSGAYDQWCWSTNMEIRSDYYMKAKYHIWSSHIKTLSLLPKLKYAGFDSGYNGITPDILFRMLLRYPFVETLVKQGDKELLEYMEDNISQVGKYWPSIKIARRHGFKIDKRIDLRMYFDYLEMSDAIGRDMRSPKYLCPKNLKKTHDEVMKLKQKLDEKIDFEKKKKKALEDEAIYQNQKGKFFGLAFGDDLIQVSVLQSVMDFLCEGKYMHHCVYTNKYYLKPESLILSAHIGDKRIETVEVNLKTLDVVQSRGVCNENTEYHDRIIGLVKKNIGLIRQRMTA